MSDKNVENRDIPNKIHRLYSEKYRSMSGDEVLIYLTEELIKGTSRLNGLTWALIGLTLILAILTGVSIYKG